MVAQDKATWTQKNLSSVNRAVIAVPQAFHWGKVKVITVYTDSCMLLPWPMPMGLYTEKEDC